MLNSFVQSVSLDVVDHLVGALRFEIGKSSETPATSEGKSTLPQTTTLTTAETGLGSWSSVALACLGKRRLSCNGLMLIHGGNAAAAAAATTAAAAARKVKFPNACSV